MQSENQVDINTDNYIIIFLEKLTLNYNHFDSKDPSNKD